MKTTPEMVIVIRQYQEVSDQQIAGMERYVNGLMLTLSQGQFDALISLGLQIGSTKLGNTAMVRYPKSDITKAFVRWGKKTGASARRKMELYRWRGAAPCYIQPEV